jgi:hypothetical protein
MARFWAAVKAAFTLESIVAGVIWYGLPIVVLLVLGLVLHAPLLTIMSLVGITVFLLVAALRWRHEGLWPFAERGVRGWKSKVTEVTPSAKYPGLWLLLFRLYGPEGRPAEGAVTCHVKHDRGEESHTPRFDDRHLHAGEPPHYSAFYPFGKTAPIPNGTYELTWREQYGLGERILAKHRRFAIKNGRVVGAKPEQERDPN